MKMLLFSLLSGCVLFPLFGQAQSSTVYGRVVLLNSGNKPVSGAEISAVGAGATLSADDGTFKLVFANKKPGDEFVMSVEKEGLEVVNTKELYQRIPAPEEVPAGIQYESKSSNIKFERPPPLDLNPEIKITMAPVGKLKITSEQYSAKLFERLVEYLKKTNTTADIQSSQFQFSAELAMRLAAIDTTDKRLSTDYYLQKSRIALQRGNLLEANYYLDYTLKTIEFKKKKIDSLQYELYLATQERLDSQQNIANKMFEFAELARQRQDYTMADSCYRAAILRSPDIDMLNGYTDFLLSQGRITLANFYNLSAQMNSLNKSLPGYYRARFYKARIRQLRYADTESLQLYEGILADIPDNKSDPANPKSYDKLETYDNDIASMIFRENPAPYNAIKTLCLQHSIEILIGRGDTVAANAQMLRLLESAASTGDVSDPGTTYRLLGDLYAAEGKDSLAELTYREGLYRLQRQNLTNVDEYSTRASRLYGGIFRANLRRHRIPEASQAFEDEMFQFGDLFLKSDEHALNDLLAGLEYLESRKLPLDTLFNLDPLAFFEPAYTTESLFEWAERLVSVDHARHAAAYGKLELLYLQYRALNPSVRLQAYDARASAQRKKALQRLREHCYSTEAWETLQALEAFSFSAN